MRRRPRRRSRKRCCAWCTRFVTADPKLSGDTDLKFGVGVGVRYFTSLGPLRADLATPLEPDSGDPKVALYIGIGQAF